MSLATTPILTAVKEAILGTIGATRTVTAGTFQYGKHLGMNDDELGERAAVLPVFDVELTDAQRAPSTTGLLGTFAVYELGVRVSVAYHLSAEVLDDARETARATALDHADVIMQALTFPRNLRQTSALVATGLCSGSLQSRGGARITREDPDNNLLLLELDFAALVSVTQAA